MTATQALPALPHIQTNHSITGARTRDSGLLISNGKPLDLPRETAMEPSASTSTTTAADAIDAPGTRRKRTRPVSACEACRAHKVKCILKPDQPICERCASSGKECLFRIDDLRPDFRAERFSHLGPPGAEAREIKSKPKDKRRDSNRQKKEASAHLSNDTDDFDEGHENDGVNTGDSELKRPKKLKRNSSSASGVDEGVGSQASGGKNKPQFKSFANPNHLAAPAPSSSISPPPPPPGMARPGPLSSSSQAAHAHSPSRGLFMPSHGHQRSPPSNWSSTHAPPPASTAPSHYSSAPYSHDPHSHFAPSVPYATRPPTQYTEPVAPYTNAPFHPAAGSPTGLYAASSHSPVERSYQHGRMPSIASSSSNSALPPIRMAFPSLEERSAGGPPHFDQRARANEWERSSVTASDTRSERPYSPVLVGRSPPAKTGARQHHSAAGANPSARHETGKTSATMSKVAFRSPPEEPSALDHPTTGSQGSRGSGAKKSSLVVPFFRWFGMTANTPGYRRIKVAVNPDLPEEEEEGLPAGTEQNDGAEHSVDHTGSSANADDFTSSLNVKTPGTVEDAGSAGSPSAATTAKTPRENGAAPISSSTPRTRIHEHTGFRSSHIIASLEQDSVASSTSRDLFDPSRPRYPRKDILLHLSELFIKYFRTNLCPWIIEDELLKSAQDCTMPSILANSICAMTARFSDWAEMKRKPPKSAGEPFSEMAKTLIVPMLSWPSLDVIEALIVLSYAEFGAGSDSGLWMYSGMGMRMAMDLGIEHESTILSLPTEAQQSKARWLFWSGCYAIDRITCFGTGRPVTLLDYAIDCQPPQVDPSADTFFASQIIQILLRRGRMGELLNRRDDGMAINEKKTKLTEMWQECATYFQSLPSACAFGVSSFKRAASKNQGAAFLYLHVLFQSTISLLERPGLMRGRELEAMPSAVGAVTHISASASRSIVDMIALAAHVDPKSFHACPYLDQLILPTGRLFVTERESVNEALRQCGYMPGQSRQSSPTRGLTKAHDERLASLMRHRKVISDQLSNCISWLSKLAHYWGGASWPARALEQEAAGASDIVPDLDDEDAMQAPLRDMELLSSWAKEKLKKAKGRLASRRGSTQGGAFGLAGAEKGLGAPSSMGSPGAATSIANLLAAANAAQNSAGSSNASSGGLLDDNPLGLALSGQLATSAEIDIHALVDMWAAEQERIQSGNGTHGATTPHSGATPGGSRSWDAGSASQHPHGGTTPGGPGAHGTIQNQHAGSSYNGMMSGFPAMSAPPPMDFSALQLEELLSADLGMASGDDVFPLELPVEDFQMGGVFGPSSQGTTMSNGGHDTTAGRNPTHGPNGTSGPGQSGDANSGGYGHNTFSYPVGALPQGISSALFGFH